MSSVYATAIICASAFTLVDGIGIAVQNAAEEAKYELIVPLKRRLPQVHKEELSARTDYYALVIKALQQNNQVLRLLVFTLHGTVVGTFVWGVPRVLDLCFPSTLGLWQPILKTLVNFLLDSLWQDLPYGLLMAVPWFLLFDFTSVTTQGIIMASLRALELAPNDWGISYLLGECAAVERHNLWYERVVEFQTPKGDDAGLAVKPSSDGDQQADGAKPAALSSTEDKQQADGAKTAAKFSTEDKQQADDATPCNG